MYFVGSLKALMTDITRRMTDKGMSNMAVLHLLYTRFQSVSSQLSPLLGEMERRTLSHPAELSSLLSECHTAYFSARRSLLISRITEEIKGLDPGSADLVELVSFGRNLVQLVSRFNYLYRPDLVARISSSFALTNSQFIGAFSILERISYSKSIFDPDCTKSLIERYSQYLESLCDYLFDDLRPRILHEGRLSVLCDVCKVLQALMVLDVPDMDSSSDEEDELPVARRVNGTKGVTQGVGRLHVGHMLQSILQDAQTRLFFKAQNVVQSDIRYFVAKPEDLDYPNILTGMAYLSDATLAIK